MNESRLKYSRMFSLLRPPHLLLAALTYALGVGISAYLGISLDLPALWLGLAAALLAQSAMGALTEVFRPHNEPLLAGEAPAQKETARNRLLSLSLGMIALQAFLTYLLTAYHLRGWLPFIFFLSSLSINALYALPPFRLVQRGLGEFLLALNLAYLIPAFGFMLQYRQTHRLLFFLLPPLTALAFACLIALSFITFDLDEKYKRGTLLRKIGWERAVPFHHSLMTFAYVIFAFTAVFFAPAIWLVMLSLPFAAFQIFHLQFIAAGGKPNWKLLAALPLATFSLTTYLLALAFWLR